jgi:hypothetical protein
MEFSESDQPLPGDEDPEEFEEEIETSQVNLEEVNQDCVQADSVRLNQCGVGRVDATEARISDSGAGQIYADSVAVRDSGVGLIQAQSVYLDGGGAAIVSAQSTTLNNTRNGFLISREVHGTQVNAVVLLATKVDGPVETLVDQRGLVLIGIVAGAVLGTVFSLFRLLKRR